MINMVDEKRVSELMKKLDLSHEEALELLAEDTKVDKMDIGKVNNDLSTEQRKVVSKMTRADRKKSDKPRKPAERKPNELKREIIDDLFTFMCTNWPEIAKNGNISNIERQIDFDLDGKSFSLTLTEHRKAKK